MTEQTRNITDAVIAQNLDNKLIRINRDKALKYVRQSENHLNTLRSFHLYGSTKEEVHNHRNDHYFSSWFAEAEAGDIQAMHSILDHFEPLQIITNLGHNYRVKFGEDRAEIILDFRPSDLVPKFTYSAEGSEVQKKEIENDDVKAIIQAYLYSCMLRMSKELLLYFPLKKMKFLVTCQALSMERKTFIIPDEEVAYFVNSTPDDAFVSEFEKRTEQSGKG